MIGVFDSGFGGLMVHRALIEALPERDFVYLGDNRNAPYGVRPPIAVLNLTCTALEPLFAEGCTLAVLACNTASTVALRWIQQQWLPVRRRDDGIARNVIGIVAPAIEAATGIGWYEGGSAVQETKQSSTVSVLRPAARSRLTVTPIEIRKRRPDITVVQQACPEVAGSIERGLPRHDLRALVDRYVSELLNKLGAAPDCVIPGCTHHPLVADLFAAALPSGARMIHQPDATARALKAYLDRHPEYDGSHMGRRTFLSTGFPADALPLIEKFWGDRVPFVQS